MTDAAQRALRYAVHAAGLLAVAAGVATCARLLAPAAPPAPRAPASAAQTDATAGTIAGWFGPGEVRASVAVKGLIKGEHQGVAILAVNGGAARAYRTGETLVPSVTLSAIEPGAVVIDKAGRSERVAAPALPEPASPGIAKVPAH